MTKIAVPVKDNLLSDVFDDCSSYVIYSINNKSNVGNKQIVSPLQSVSELLEGINKSGITDIIVHRMDKLLIKYFSETKINLFIGVPIEKPEVLINEYLNGTLLSDVSKVS